MSAFNFLKNVFGFSNEEYTDKEQNEYTPYINPFKKEEDNNPESDTGGTPPQNEEQNVEISIDKSLDEEIVVKITDILNAGLPDYIKKFIDLEAEKNYVRQSFGKAFEKYTTEIKEEISIKAKSQWQADRINLEQQAVTLGNQIAELKAKNDELRNRITSLDRQRNTLKEQLAQADNKAATAEAEREQFQLECKSLINKLKVSSVNEETVNSLKEENDTLYKEKNTAEAEIAKLKEALKSKSEENTSLSEKLQAFESSGTNDQKKLIETLQNEITELTDNTYSLKEQLNTAKENNTAWQDELDRIRRECEIKNNEISSLQSTIATLEKQLSESEEKINEAKEYNSNEIKTLNRQIAAKEQEIENQKNNENKLRQQIEQLSTKNQEIEKQLKKRREEKVVLFDEDDEKSAKPNKKENAIKERRKVSAIDYAADYSDWLMPTPPTSEIPINLEDEPEQNNKVKTPSEKRHNAPSQMELF